uniref:response regulator n=1 Tax=Pandoraea sputorum TaxID=93222 RepID=UPI00355804BE
MRKVLCIEDDHDTAQEIASELRRVGFVVECADDGLRGLELALAGGFDAITLDRMLAGLDGLQVITRLRAAGVQTPVLMISALTDVDDRIRGLRAGGDDYLVKPFVSEEMATRIHVLLRRHID